MYVSQFINSKISYLSVWAAVIDVKNVNAPLKTNKNMFLL